MLGKDMTRGATIRDAAPAVEYKDNAHPTETDRRVPSVGIELPRAAAENAGGLKTALRPSTGVFFFSIFFLFLFSFYFQI